MQGTTMLDGGEGHSRCLAGWPARGTVVLLALFGTWEIPMREERWTCRRSERAITFLTAEVGQEQDVGV